MFSVTGAERDLTEHVMNNKAIAVVDSGVGGLVCLKAIRKALPGEDIIYFGDTANMPYGTKSREEVCALADKFTSFLCAHGIKMIILACGTLSSTAIPFFYKNYPELLVQGVIDPVVSAAARQCDEDSNVGVIATPRSIESDAYAQSFERLRKHLNVFYRGCPELSVYIEKGITEGPEMEELLHGYLDEMVYEDKIESLVLGCTHYPLVSGCINKLYPQLKLIEPSEALAKNAKVLLTVHGMDSGKDDGGTLCIYASKKTDGFIKMADSLGFGDALFEEVTL